MLWNAKNGSVPIDSTEMSYVSFGHGEKKLIVLPGLSDGLMTVRGKTLLLAAPFRQFFEKYTVYMFSRKDSMPEGYSIRDMAEDQAKALQYLGISETSVLGVSEGGMVAQYLAILHPELMDKLILAVTAPCPNELSEERVKKWISFAEAGDHKALMIDTAENSYSPATLKKYRQTYPFIGAVGKPKSYDRFLINARAILGFDASDELGGIHCPTLIIAGENDKIVGVQASYALHNRILGSELYVYPGLGHAAYEEAKDFYQRILLFLERT
jgi:pimeloyl-ACP methyl ester carboxylesterase